MYHALAKYHSDQKWVIERGYHTYLKVYGHTFRFHHGDHVRYNGGVGGIYVPLQRAIYQWNQQQHADVECVGHWHQYTPHRKYVVNGSLIGYNAYALAGKFAYEPPMQALFLLDKRRGVSVHIPILVED